MKEGEGSGSQDSPGFAADRVCVHGKTNHWWWDTCKGGWAGGISTCKCCGASFGYLDSAAYSQNQSSGTTTDKDLCSACGGKVRTWKHP